MAIAAAKLDGKELYMTRTGERVRAVRKRKGISQRDLASKTGITHATISDWERGKKEPSYTVAKAVADELRLEFDSLWEDLQLERYKRRHRNLRIQCGIDDHVELNVPHDLQYKDVAHTRGISVVSEGAAIPVVAIPILGEIPAGDPIVIPPVSTDVEHTWVENYRVVDPKKVFAMRVVGESMIGRGIQEGDVIVIDTFLEPSEGDTVVAQIDGQATVKQIHFNEHAVMLLSANPQVLPIIVPEEQCDRFRVIGPVVQINKHIKARY